ncbi:MAG: S9 family peptidase, partial [Stenotrophomonas maltophilia]|nr:S9 family peptidase [Stenotrophomonas maltophilia]
MLIRRTSLAAAVAVATVGLLAAGPAFADYAKPPEHLLKVLKAPPPPAPNVAPGGQRLLLTTAQTYPSISRVAQPYLKLAGVRLEPKNRSRHDT